MSREWVNPENGVRHAKRGRGDNRFILRDAGAQTEAKDPVKDVSLWWFEKVETEDGHWVVKHSLWLPQKDAEDLYECLGDLLEHTDKHGVVKKEISGRAEAAEREMATQRGMGG